MDEFLWLPLPLSPKNQRRALIASSLALIAFIDVLSLSAPPIEHFIITLLLDLFIYTLQYSTCQAFLPVSEDEKFMDIGRERIRAFGEDLKIISIPLCLK